MNSGGTQALRQSQESQTPNLPIAAKIELPTQVARRQLDEKVASICRTWEELQEGATSPALCIAGPTLLSDLLAQGEGNTALFLIPDELKGDLCTPKVKKWIKVLETSPYPGATVKTLPSFAKALGEWAKMWKTGEKESISKVAVSICWALETKCSNEVVGGLIDQFARLYVGAMNRGGEEKLIAKRAVRDLYIGDDRRPLIHHLISMKSAGFGHLQVLVKNRIELNRVDYGVTPLGLAVDLWIKPTVSLFMNAGVEIDTKCESAVLLLDEMLFDAARACMGDSARSIEKIALLVKQGADINALDSKGVSPLGTAIRYSHNAPLGDFLDLGADPSAGRALEIAMELGDDEIVSSLVAKGALRSVFERDDWKSMKGVVERFGIRYKRMLNDAARAGAPKTVWYLLGRGFGIHTKVNGKTPLFSLLEGRVGRGVRQRDVDTAERLITIGATIDPKDLTIEMAKVGKAICEKAGVWK